MSSLRIAAVLLVASVATRATSGTPRTLSTDQEKILDSARAYALSYTAKLPNFICTQVTKRDSSRANTYQSADSGIGGAYYGLSDEIVEKVTYFDQKENYEVISINNRKVAGTKHGEVAGATSAGEFGSALLAIFDPKSHAVFSGQRMAELRGHPVDVFAYQVPKEAGIHVSARNSGEEIVAPYHGLVFFDAEANEVLRIMTHFDLPHGFPIQVAWRLVDYAPVTIAGRRYNLPARAEVNMQSGPDSFVNKIAFKEYREFAVESTIRFGTLEEPAPANAAPANENAKSVSIATTQPAESVNESASGATVARQVEPHPVQTADATHEGASVSPATPAAIATSPHTLQQNASAPKEAGKAQEAAPAPHSPVAKAEPNTDSTLRLRLSTDLVLVPVVVKDASGRARANLRKEDFQIFDKGKRREITSFTVETREGPAESVAGRRNATVGEQGPTAGSRMPVNYIVYFFDDIHLKFDELAWAREAARRNVETLPSTDLTAVLTTSGLVDSPLTTDREKFKAALLKLQAEPLGGTSTKQCPDIDAYMADMILNHPGAYRLLIEAAIAETTACLQLPTDPQAGGGNQSQLASNIVQQAARSAEKTGEYQSRQSLLQLRDVVRWLGKAPGTRSIILVSPGFTLGNSAQFDGADVVDEAIRSEVTINALDARGVYGENPAGNIEDKSADPTFARMKASVINAEATAATGVMVEMAAGTGGNFIRNTNDMYGGLQALAAPPACTYVLGFKPTDLKLDGSFHALQVKLNAKEKLTVQARRGYFATKR